MGSQMFGEQWGDDLDESPAPPEESGALEGKPMIREHAWIKVEGVRDRGNLSGYRPLDSEEGEKRRDPKRLLRAGAEVDLIS